MPSNRQRIDYLKDELDKIGDEIQRADKEQELKEFARNIADGTKQPTIILPEVFDKDPNRFDRICEYYLYLFSEYDAIRREEYASEQAGKESHEKWLADEYQPTGAFKQIVIKIAKGVATKIAVSGITAGLIWLGKELVHHWPLGYSIADSAEPVSDKPKNENAG